MIALALLALGAILAAAVCLIRVEWLMTFHDPPDLSRSTRRRLREHARTLAKEEDEVGRILGLVHAPRLSIVDEESAALLRASDRQHLLATGDDVEPSS